jgi:hypothetical protein
VRCYVITLREIGDPIWVSTVDILAQTATATVHLVRLSGSATTVPCRLMDCDSPQPSEHIERSDLENHAFAQYILQEHGTYFPKWAIGISGLIVASGNTHIIADPVICPGWWNQYLT